MKPRVLLHSCCGPCSVYPLDALRAEGHEPAMFFFNPNIQPYQEFVKRLDAVKLLAQKTGVPLQVDDAYDVVEWLRLMVFREPDRCLVCCRLRLDRAARAAKAAGFEAFSTSMLYSRHQKHDLIRELASAVSEEVGVPFLYRDFRKGCQAGIEAGKKMGLYRQQYCGCIYSEQERYLGPLNPAASAGARP